jgi:hypothetical protein
LPGDYLAILTVSDGAQTATDSYVLHVYLASASGSSGPLPSHTGYSLGGDVEASAGEKIQLDGRGRDGLQFADKLGWQLTKPSGSHAALSNSLSPFPYFTPDVPGYYTVVAGHAHLVVGVGVTADFSPPVQITVPSGGAPTATGYPDIGDVNHDGRVDVVYPYSNGTFSGASKGVMELLQQADGRFVPNLISSTTSFAVHLADIDGDGLTDIVANQFVTIQAADGTMGSPIASGVVQPFVSSLGTGTSSYQASFGTDLSGNYGVHTYAYSAPSTFTPGFASLGSFGQYSFLSPGTESLNDVTGDGIPDFVGSDFYLSTPGGQKGPFSIVVQPGLADGTFGSAQTYQIPFTNLTGASLAVGDLNGDGLKDIAVVSNDGTDAAIFYQQSDGTMGPAISKSVPTFSPEAAYLPTIADINGDGRNDLLLISRISGACFLNVNLQKSNGNLGPSYSFPVVTSSFGDGSGTVAIYVKDIDGDGTPDVLISDGEPVVGQLILTYGIPFN